MRKPRCGAIVLASGVAAGCLSLAACNNAQVDLPATVTPEPVLVTSSAKGFEGKITIDGGIAAIPRLHELIEPRMRGALAEAQVMAQADLQARGAAVEAGYFFSADWTSRPAGDRYLDVHGVVSQFTGGAHPVTAIEAFVWDRLGQRRLALSDLLIDPRSGSEGVMRLATAAREALIAVKRTRIPGYDPAKDGFIGTGPDGPFAPDPAKFGRNFALIPASDAGGGAVEFYYSPYDVGPYVEGKYEVRVPAAVVAPLLKPDAARVLE